MGLAVLFRGWFRCVASSEERMHLVAVSIDHFIGERHSLMPPRISMENYGEKNVKKYADRFSPYGRDKSCGR
jgi:hypothetical protein